MKKLLQLYYPQLFIFAVFITLYITNYVPGTYLTGWDNLQTELNPLLGIKRNLFASWQEYQSLGLPAGMGHAADLLRTIILYLASFIIPQEMIRYSFHMSMILIGGLGTLKLLKLSGFDKEKTPFALTGSIFYILNFAIIQMMHLPYEAFSVFFGLLPWQIWTFLNILSKEKSTPRDYLIFIGINIAGTPAFIAQQLFVVYFLILALLGIGILIKNHSLQVIKKGVISVIILLVLNSFWLLPQVYFLQQNGVDTVKYAKINQIATSEVFYVNLDKGNSKDFISFNGFFYDSKNAEQDEIFSAWKTHRENVTITTLIYILSAIYLLGLLSPSRFRIPFTLAYIVILIGLLNNTTPLKELNDILRSNSFINQIFRSPFTKFSIPYALVASYLFTSGVAFLFSLKLTNLKNKKVQLFMLSLLTFTLFLVALPAFKGHYISQQMKVKIPSGYLQTIEYFKDIDKNKRIALLPDYTFWGWFHHNWTETGEKPSGYDGSGFIWYGIEQPIISRTFDVWDIKSESYFWEIKKALESEDVMSFEKVLKKYNVNYLILDTTLLPIISNNKSLQYPAIEKMLKESASIELSKDLGKIKILKVKEQRNINNFIWTAKDLPNIGPQITLTNEDTAFTTYGDYITTSEYPYDVYLPFLDLTTQTRLNKKLWDIEESKQSWTLSAKTPLNARDYNLISSTEETLNLYDKLGGSTQFLLPILTTAEKNTIKVEFPKIQIKSFAPIDTSVTKCQNENGQIEKLDNLSSTTILSTNGATGCFSYQDTGLDQRYGYIVTAKSTNENGRKLYFYILDRTKNQAYTEEVLESNTEHFIIGSKNSQGLGYDFTFQNKSHSTISTQNTLNSLTIDLIPYSSLKDTKFVKKNQIIPTQRYGEPISSKKHSYYNYTMEISSSDKILVLNQSYNAGWHAYRVDKDNWINNNLPFITGKELKTHFPVNNWANGWYVPSSTNSNSTVVLMYTPQYLEFIGLGALFITTLLSLISYLKHSRNKQIKISNSRTDLT